MKRLSPILHKEAYTRRLQKELQTHVSELISQPLACVLDNAISNDALLTAIASGRITHDGSTWKGEATAAISKRIHELGGWRVMVSQLPEEVRTALAEARQKFTDKRRDLLAALALAGANLLSMAGRDPVQVEVVEPMLWDLQAQFDKATNGEKPVPEGALDPSEAARKVTFAKDYLVAKTVDLYRQAVAQATDLADLETRLSIAESKIASRTDFIAEQVASEIVAKAREELAKAVGAESYRWITVRDSRVRHDHKLLDGRVFRFDNPPIVDTATGRRGNPGEDYNCRCHAEILLPE